MQLALHVNKDSLVLLGPADNIINNDVCVSVFINNNIMQSRETLPRTINVVDERNECGWAINRPKRHHVI
jgi:hypothetical protein